MNKYLQIQLAITNKTTTTTTKIATIKQRKLSSFSCNTLTLLLIDINKKFKINHRYHSLNQQDKIILQEYTQKLLLKFKRAAKKRIREFVIYNRIEKKEDSKKI